MAKGEYEKYNNLLNSYSDSEHPLPEDTAHSPLREVYTFFRLHEQCSMAHIEGAYGPTAQQVFFLLFNKNVRLNFSKAHQTDIQTALNAINKFNPKEIKMTADEVYGGDQEYVFLKRLEKEGKLDEHQKSYLDKHYQVPTVEKISEMVERMKGALTTLLDGKKLSTLSTHEVSKLPELLIPRNAEEEVFLRSFLKIPKKEKGQYSGYLLTEIEESLNTQVIGLEDIPMSWHEAPRKTKH